MKKTFNFGKIKYTNKTNRVNLVEVDVELRRKGGEATFTIDPKTKEKTITGKTPEYLELSICGTIQIPSVAASALIPSQSTGINFPIRSCSIRFLISGITTTLTGRTQALPNRSRPSRNGKQMATIMNIPLFVKCSSGAGCTRLIIPVFPSADGTRTSLTNTVTPG